MRRGARFGPGGGRAAGDRAVSRLQGRARLQVGGRVRGGQERTLNMASMFVTREVSKLSGWLNAGAYCRESKGGRTVRGGVRASRRGRRVQRAREAQLQILVAQTRRGAHQEHLVHVCDAGGVEAQRPVERLRGLPRVERRACAARRREAVAISVQERARLQAGGRARARRTKSSWLFRALGASSVQGVGSTACGG